MQPMSQEVKERLQPTLFRLLERASFPPDAIQLTTVSHFISVDNRSHWLEVTVMDGDGARLVARLDPARYGLTWSGNELVTLIDPGEAFSPLA